MDKNWSPEPWHLNDICGISGPRPRWSKEDQELYGYSDEEKEDVVVTDSGHYPPDENTMNRIVACVNGCADIPKPEGLVELVDYLKLLRIATITDESWQKGIDKAFRACGIEV